MIIDDVFFWVLAATAVVSALAMIHTQNIFRAAIMLVVTFVAVAGLFVLLSAEFLAVVQVLIYAGAISILLIFAVLLTREGEEGNPANRLRIPAALGAALMLVVLVTVIAATDWLLLDGTLETGAMARVDEVFASTPIWLASLLLKEWVLPFEIASVLLLAAAVGALVIVRERQS